MSMLQEPKTLYHLFYPYSILGLSVIFMFGFMGGCTIDRVAEKDLRLFPELHFIEPNTLPVQITLDEKKALSIAFKQSKIVQSEIVRLPYSDFYWDWLGLVVVPGRLPNGREYNVWIDTGFNSPMMINGIAIRENGLSYFPLNKNGGYDTGVCHLPELQLGNTIFHNPPCFYYLMRWEWSFLGMPLYRQKGMLLGRGLLAEFSYLLFDNPRKELEMSYKNEFQPDDPNAWRNYPIEIANLRNGEDIMILIPIGDKEVRISFDTCGSYPVIARPELWELLHKQVGDVPLKTSSFLTGFHGWLPCKKGKIDRLRIAGQECKNLEVIVLNEDSPYASGLSCISLTLFKDSVVVLDFKHNLFWIKD